ncbi:hypothetical protein BC834DRAFT_894903, partial [Gloeopeniophorella convolvens]
MFEGERKRELGNRKPIHFRTQNENHPDVFATALFSRDVHHRLDNYNRSLSTKDSEGVIKLLISRSGFKDTVVHWRERSSSMPTTRSALCALSIILIENRYSSHWTLRLV